VQSEELRVKITLKVVPSSSRDTVVGWLGDALKLKVRAPPEKGRANKAVAALLCKTLALPKGAVVITSGLGSTSKTAEIESLTCRQLMEKLTAAGIESEWLQ
jgi:uncharacterized protein (TIGR00251 family)